MRLLIIILMLGVMPMTALAQETVTLSLVEVLQQASRSNPSLLMSQERVSMAIARLGQARSELLPQLTGSIAGSRQVRDLRTSGMSLPGVGPNIGPYNAYDARVKLTMDLFNPSALKRLAAAKLAKEASVSQMDKSKQDILALAANLYLEAKRNYQSLYVATQVLAYQQAVFNKAQVSFKQGLINDVELAFEQANLDQVKFLCKQAQANSTQSRLDLLAFLGIDGDRTIIYKKDALIKTAEDALESPQVRVAQADVLTAQAQTAAVKAGLLPQITGIADFGLAGRDFNHDSRIYTVGLQATIPFWQGGLTQEQINEARAKEKELSLALDDIKRKVNNDKQTSRAIIEKSKGLLQFRYSQLKAQRKSFVMTQRRVEQGLDDDIMLKQGMVQRLQAYDDFQEALALYQMAYIALAHAQGNIERFLK